jgi:integrase
MLTDKAIKSASVRDRPYKIADTEQMYLLVHTNGSKYFRMDYQFGGKRKTKALGKYPDITLIAARQLRDEAKEALRGGIDPNRKEEESVEVVDTFGTIADTYVKERLVEAKPPKAQVTIDKNKYLLEKLCGPIRETPIKELTAAAILTLLKTLEHNNQIETAHRLRTTIGSVCRFAISQLKLEHDPTSALRNSLRPRNAEPQAAITEETKFGQMLQLIDKRLGQPQVTLALKLMVLCYPRPVECRTAKWEDVDLVGKVWHIPEYATKMRRPHDIPLSRQAIEIFRQLRALTKGELVFPSHNPQKPISENAMNQALRRMGITGEEHCSHGFRASASTILNDRKFDERVIEISLSHLDPSQTRRAYNRALYWEERVDMAQKWADICDTLKAGKPVKVRKKRDNTDLV